MSRKEEKMNNRCPICGGRMRLVNVTWVNTFQTPEAEQYDLSVSRRKTLRKKAAAASSQEMMCSACCRRTPITNKNGKATKKAVKKVEKQVKKNKKKSGGSAFGTILLLVILAALVYLGYTYFDAIVAFLQPAINFVTNLFQK